MIVIRSLVRQLVRSLQSIHLTVQLIRFLLQFYLKLGTIDTDICQHHFGHDRGIGERLPPSFYQTPMNQITRAARLRRAFIWDCSKYKSSSWWSLTLPTFYKRKLWHVCHLLCIFAVSICVKHKINAPKSVVVLVASRAATLRLCAANR
jgi:hypothetical protein